jgi:Uma2 family endonuclease
MEAAGLFDQELVELVDGELISRMGKKPRHSDAADLMHEWLFGVFGLGGFVRSESPIDVAPEDNPTNEPVPDLVVLRRTYTGFQAAVPRPDELELVVEVDATTLTFDLTVKAVLYARAGIIEYWVLDVTGRRLIAHRNPQEGQ